MTRCPTGKVTLPSKTAARASAKRLRDRVQGAHPYHCDQCHGWHVGSNVAGRVPAPVNPRDLRPRREVPPDPPGTTYCPGCGHRTGLHRGALCVGDRGACGCSSGG